MYTLIIFFEVIYSILLYTFFKLKSIRSENHKYIVDIEICILFLLFYL